MSAAAKPRGGAAGFRETASARFEALSRPTADDSVPIAADPSVGIFARLIDARGSRDIAAKARTQRELRDFHGIVVRLDAPRAKGG